MLAIAKGNDFLFKLIVFFIFFDGIRSNSVFSSYLSMVREMTVAILIFECLFVRKYSVKKIYDKTLLTFTAYHIFICVLTITLPGYVQLSFLLKPIVFGLSIYVFFYYRELTRRSYADLFTFSVYVSVVFVIFNTLCFFIPMPFIGDLRWWGRISVGYPTMDVVTLAYALIILFFYPHLKINSVIKSVMIIIVSIGILLNFSGTGMVLLALIIATFICRNFIKAGNKKVAFLTITICILFSMPILNYFKSNFYTEYRDGLILIENKIDILLGKEVDANTMEIRQEQYQKQAKGIPLIEKIIGKTLINASNDGSKLSKGAFMIEDQYNHIFICYGYIGFALFIAIILSYIISIIKIRGELDIKIMLLLSAIIFALNSRTLLSLVLFPNYMFIAVFMAYTRKLYKRKINETRYRLSLPR